MTGKYDARAVAGRILLFGQEFYRPITLEEIPDGVRFDVPAHRQGQIVEVAYGGFGRAEHGPGDEYKRVHDRSEGPNAVRYYRLCGGAR